MNGLPQANVSAIDGALSFDTATPHAVSSASFAGTLASRTSSGLFNTAFKFTLASLEAAPLSLGNLSLGGNFSHVGLFVAPSLHGLCDRRERGELCDEDEG